MLPHWGSPMFFASKNQPDKENQPNTRTHKTLHKPELLDLSLSYFGITRTTLSHLSAAMLLSS